MKLKNIVLGLTTLRFAAYLYKKAKSDLVGKWIIKEGWFGNEEILLEKLDEVEHQSLGTALVFEENNVLSQMLHNPGKLELGGMGKLYFNAATWKADKKEITFNINGGHVVSNTFHYNMSYTINSISKNKILLKKASVILFEEKMHS